MLASVAPIHAFGSPRLTKERVLRFSSPNLRTPPQKHALRKGTPHPKGRTGTEIETQTGVKKSETSNQHGSPATVESDKLETSIRESINTQEDDELLYASKCKSTKRVKNYKWKSNGSGILRLYYNKSTGKKRMELKSIDNDTVYLNQEVFVGMAFLKVVKDSKVKGVRSYVRFAAVEDESKGLVDIFMLQVSSERVDKLYSTLKGMSSGRVKVKSEDVEKDEEKNDAEPCNILDAITEEEEGNAKPDNSADTEKEEEGNAETNNTVE